MISSRSLLIFDLDGARFGLVVMLGILPALAPQFHHAADVFDAVIIQRYQEDRAS